MVESSGQWSLPQVNGPILRSMVDPLFWPNPFESCKTSHLPDQYLFTPCFRGSDMNFILTLRNTGKGCHDVTTKWPALPRSDVIWSENFAA